MNVRPFNFKLLPASVKILSCGEVREAAEVVLKGGLVVYPTDTVYGLGCDPRNERAVRAVLEAKMRPDKPLPILCSSLSVMKGLGVWNPLAERLASRFLPGPLTLVLEARDKGLPKGLIKDGKVGLRVPAHKVARELIGLVGGALVGTSANLSGTPPPRSPEEVLSRLGPRFDVMLDCGPTPLGIPSTVVDVSGGRVEVIREGFVSKEEVLSWIST